MALDDFKIAESDYTGRDVSGLANRPALSAAALKARFDSLVKNVVAVKYNGLVEALKTALAGLAPRVSGAVNGNFAALTSGGELADSGKNAADFVAASAVIGLSNGGHGKTNAKEGLEALCGLSKLGFEYQTSDYDINTILDGVFSVYSNVQNTASLFAIIGGISPQIAYIVQCFGTVSTTGNRWQLAFGFQHNTKMAFRRYRANTQTWDDWTEVLTGRSALHLEAAASITLSSIVTQYEVNVSWAAPGMWFEAIRTDATMTYFLHPIRAICESAGKVKVYLNAYPDAAINGTSMGLKISGWL